uniref:ADP-ribosylation factor-like protein 6 n=1 Tax=Lotharella oceanica TaxID=641309 RepID=A0A7S2TNL2_9EUKA|mmetsp:Transcript_22476/g.42223  ORF Transcript_22476/g.42223 Transcript_22476/m.42223 type:complete len:181 (+) Transcript_22476:76-618(+)|eukprot:CAMPEP_0170184396 /NCGR_PEP_ID=MMETSP0040_2-20121228/33521_1 /TAXON_ID=641309 /ORGANISM="Lotharella oceanica, Strain CCMP622" /LENGTH=180 /DNA_ID=CAMNT_0010430457 /DNA_START=22 /DNA_END=564 /DNA_ORIENTATION=-
MGIGKSKKPKRCLVVGLDNSGKSTIVNWLKPTKEKKDDVQATVGLSEESFKYMGTNFTMFDMSGAGQYRNLWEKFYEDTDGVIFVVDSADKVRMCVAKDELGELLTHKSIKGSSVPILLFANKCDKQQSLSTAEVSRALSLTDILDHPWMIIKTCAINGEGIEKGIKWLKGHLEEKKDKK